MINKFDNVIEFAKLNKDNLEYCDSNIQNLHIALKYGCNLAPTLAVTTEAYLEFFKKNNLTVKITDLLSTIHFERPESVMQVSTHIQKMIQDGMLQEELTNQLLECFNNVKNRFKKTNLLIGEADLATNDINKIKTAIKQAWSSKFTPGQILKFHQQKLDMFKASPIIIIKKLDANKSGSIHTLDYKINTDFKLSDLDLKELKEICQKLKKHIYFPQIVKWQIVKGKIYITGIRPLTDPPCSRLVLVRHGQSVWNEKGLWTGWTDVALSPLGHKQARDAGKNLKNIHFDQAYTSSLLRAIQTLAEIEKGKEQLRIPTKSNKALNERDYGTMTGKNKWEVEKEVGEEQFLKWRRGWDEPIPGGESLKDVYERVVPYYDTKILPQLKSGKNVIIAAHGNSLRALAKYLENMSDEQITKFEIGVGEILIYRINEDGKVDSKQVLEATN